jgi:hypothetical protein
MQLRISPTLAVSEHIGDRRLEFKGTDHQEKDCIYGELALRKSR